MNGWHAVKAWLKRKNDRYELKQAKVMREVDVCRIKVRMDDSNISKGH